MNAIDFDAAREQILGSAAALKSLRSGYGPLLDYYSAIFLAQAESARGLTLPAVQVEERLRATRMAAGFPLVGLAALPWDPAAAGALMAELCRIVARQNPGLADAARSLLKALEEGHLSSAALCGALLQEDDPFFSHCSQDLAIDKGFLAFMAYHALRPSLEAAAVALSPLIKEEKGWERGICPICGSLPGISRLQGDGERMLVCGMCAHPWLARRLFCPFCQERDPRRLRYSFSAEEPEYRTELCEGCHRYLKTVDSRQLSRPLYLPLEQVASLHLDLQANQEGFLSELPYLAMSKLFAG